jgi:hypothetical protein
MHPHIGAGHAGCVDDAAAAVRNVHPEGAALNITCLTFNHADTSTQEMNT